MKLIYQTSFLILFVTFVNHAQASKEKIKISGSIFNDFFYNINSSDSTQKDLYGFTVRRVYFTTDYTLSDDFEARLRFQGNESSSSLTSGGKFSATIKDAFLRWKNIFNGSDLLFGLAPTPLYEMSDTWGYRSLEKSPPDLYDVVPFRDIGIDLKGKLTDDGKYYYWIKFGNNSSNTPETNKDKRFYCSILMKPLDGLEIGMYGDYASMPAKLDKYDDQKKSNNQVVYALFITHKNEEKNACGANMFVVNAQNNFSSSSVTPLQNQTGVCYSFWGWISINEKLRLVGRIDRFNQNIDLDHATLTFGVAGLDYRPSLSVSVIPNIEWFNYQKNFMGKVGTDLIARLTFAYQF